MKAKAKWLVACRFAWRNEVFEFKSQRDAKAFAKDCQSRSIETAISKYTY